MRSVSALRAMARQELRLLARRRGHSLLIALLVAVPAAAVVGAGSLLRIVERSPEERAAAVVGAADLRVEVAGGHEAFERARAALPADARVAPLFNGPEVVRGEGRRLRAIAYAMPAGALDAGGVAAGMLQTIEGRWPAHPGEVALSPTLLQGLGRALGDTVALGHGPWRRVVGVAVIPEATDQPIVVRTPAPVEDRGAHVFLVTTQDSKRSVAALKAKGFAVTTRTEASRGDVAVETTVALLGAIGFFEAALVIASAFAVGLRRRRRDLGLLASLGAPAREVTLVLTLSAAFLAALGSLIGTALGLGAAALIYPNLDVWNRRLNGPFEVAPEFIALALAGGVLTAIAAAALPAAQAARLPIRIALGARRPAETPSRRWVVVAILSVAIAIVLLATLKKQGQPLAGFSVVIASLLAVLGFGAASPWLLGRAALAAGKLPLAWRLAVRDAGRHRTRHGPVLTAVLAAMAMSVTVATMVSSLEAMMGERPARLRDDQLVIEGPAAEDVARRIAREFPSVAIAPLRSAQSNGTPIALDEAGGGRPRWIACGDEALLQALGGERGLDAFRAGRVVALAPAVGKGALRVRVGRDGPKVEGAVVERITATQNVLDLVVVIANDRLESLGLEGGPPPRKSLVPWIVRLERPVREAQLARARALAGEDTRATVDAALDDRSPGAMFPRVLLAICAFTGLVIVLVATALSAAESAADERVLRTVGAPPALLRAHAGARAGYLALLGCVLAVPAGLLVAAGLIANANVGLPFTLPWAEIALVLLVLPVAAYVVAWRFGSFVHAPRGARAALAIGASLALLGSAAGSVRAADSVRWERYVGKAVDGTPLEGEFGRITVPEDRARANGKTIEIAFVRYRSAHPNPGPPIVYFEGGPGGSGVEGCAFVATHPALRLLEHADVIGVDQRGTGLSRPNLAAVRFDYALPLDRALTRVADARAFTAAVARAVGHWRARGVDLAAYDSEQSADDIDAVREALGAEQIVAYGDSYGSHLALAYLRRHGAHVARAVLQKVEGPDHTWKSPSAVQRRLEAVAALAAADPQARKRVPDLIATIRTLLAKLEREPVAVTLRPAGPHGVRVVVGAYDLRLALAQALARTRSAAGIADFVDRCARGDWRPLATFALEYRRGTVESAMAIAMDCASGITADRRARYVREANDPANVLADALDAPFYREACAPCGDVDLGDAYRGPIETNVPVLCVSGELDARTPPENVEQIAPGFARHTHLRVAGAGHDARELIAEEYRDALHAFMRGERVESMAIALPFRFEWSDETR